MNWKTIDSAPKDSTDDKILGKFYNERLIRYWNIPFVALGEGDKKYIRGTLTFASYRLDYHISELGNSIIESVKSLYS